MQIVLLIERYLTGGGLYVSRWPIKSQNYFGYRPFGTNNILFICEFVGSTLAHQCFTSAETSLAKWLEMKQVGAFTEYDFQEQGNYP